MKKILFCFIAVILIASCSAPRTAPPMISPSSTASEPLSTPAARNGNNLTRIFIDGNPTDWAAYLVLYEDPVGDSTHNVDIKSVRAFLNNEYLYVLVEVNGEIGSYVQLDLDINLHSETGLPDYMANSYPNNGDSVPHLARIENGEFHHLENQTGEVAQGEVFELRIPLDLLDGAAIETISLRVMDGECCGDQWVAVDSTDSIEVPKTDEIEAPFIALTNLTAPDSAFCTRAALERPDSLEPATDIDVPEGFDAEYFIPPSGVNVPSDVVVMPNGEILVASSRSGAIHRIGTGGVISSYAQLHAYSLDADSSGSLYGYSFPDGAIYRIAENSEGTFIAQMPDTACESTMAVAPDGTIYIGFNLCSGQSAGESGIYKIPAGGGEPALLTAVQEEGVQALDMDSSGRLFAMIGQSLETVDTNTGDRQQVSELPEWPSFHGLVIAEDGTAFISTGDFESEGSLFRVSPDGEVEKLASLPNNGLEGLALTQDGEVVGTQRAIGGVQVIGQDGNVRALVEPNGLVSPQSLAFSPCGELLTVNDESGRLTLAYPNGKNIPFTPIISFQPPQTFLAFSPDGWYVTGESAPGFPSRVNRYLPSGSHESLTTDLAWVSGVTVAANDLIYVSATHDGKIYRLLPDGSREVFAEGLRFPQALAINFDGALYAVIGGQAFGDVFAVPTQGDSIVAITPDGLQKTLAQIPDAAQIAIGPEGWLYVAAGESVVRLNAEGKQETFAGGFASARGVAFDIAGNLYVADDNGNDIVRISWPATSYIRGEVSDANGNPIAGVFVRVTRSNPPFAGQLALTGADGAFSISALKGEYTVTVWAKGYQVAVVDVSDIGRDVVLVLQK